MVPGPFDFFKIQNLNGKSGKLNFCLIKEQKSTLLFKILATPMIASSVAGLILVSYIGRVEINVVLNFCRL
jgi:hypothetical protein